jgi:hypothetical protein
MYLMSDSDFASVGQPLQSVGLGMFLCGEIQLSHGILTDSVHNASTINDE